MSQRVEELNESNKEIILAVECQALYERECIAAVCYAGGFMFEKQE